MENYFNIRYWEKYLCGALDAQEKTNLYALMSTVGVLRDRLGKAGGILTDWVALHLQGLSSVHIEETAELGKLKARSLLDLCRGALAQDGSGLPEEDEEERLFFARLQADLYYEAAWLNRQPSSLRPYLLAALQADDYLRFILPAALRDITRDLLGAARPEKLDTLEQMLIGLLGGAQELRELRERLFAYSFDIGMLQIYRQAYQKECLRFILYTDVCTQTACLPLLIERIREIP